MLIDRTQRTQDFGEHVAALENFSRTVRTVFDPQDGASLFACRDALEHLLTTDWLACLVSKELERLAEGDTCAGGLSELRMTLTSGDNWALSLTLALPGQASTPDRLFGIARHVLVGVMGPAEIAIKRYFQPRPFPSDVLDRSRRLEDRGTDLVPAGQTATIVAGHDVVWMRATKAPTVVVLLETGWMAATSWRYDASTLLPEAVIAVSGTASRLEFATSVLARLGGAQCTPTLQNLFQHPDHVVRWAAVRALMKLDRGAGMQLLISAAADSHPHVREAAQAALARRETERHRAGAAAA